MNKYSWSVSSAALIFSCLLMIMTTSCAYKHTDDGELMYIEADSLKGFNFPYYLFIPQACPQETPVHLMVEPNNSGFVSDTFEDHAEKAERTATKDFYIGNFVSRNLGYPLLVPVFPRPESNWKIYTHALDRDAILQEGNNLERLDLQLLAMADDASLKLQALGFNLSPGLLMTGFSASGTFVNRFTFIHPEKVAASAAGGLNGLLILPLDSLNGRGLFYPVGKHDFNTLFGFPFDSASFAETPQFLFMGELDENDAIPYADGYDDPERELIYSVLGQEMMPLRWENCRDIYQQHKVHAVIKTYDSLGHDHPEKVKREILEFFKSATGH